MSETSNIYTPSTTPTRRANVDSSNDAHSSIPCPGSVFIIRCKSSGKVITFLDGKIIMDSPGGLGTYRWKCVATDGWLGFQDPASAQYLGYDEHEVFRCYPNKHQHWEFMNIRHVPEGGYTISMVSHSWRVLIPLVPYKFEGVDRVKLAAKSDDQHFVWEFIKVDTETAN